MNRRGAPPGARLLRRWLRLLPPCEPGLLLYDVFAGPDGAALDLRRIGPLSPPGVEAWSVAAGDWVIHAGRVVRRSPPHGPAQPAAAAAFVPLDGLDARLLARLAGGCPSQAVGQDNGLLVRFGGLPETCAVGYNDRAGVFRIVQTCLGPGEKPVETILASAPCRLDPAGEHVIEAAVQGDCLRATLDGRLSLCVGGLVSPPYANGVGLRLAGGGACREFRVYRVKHPAR